MTRERIAEKRREMGPYTFAAQLLLDPSADRTQGFLDEWLRHLDAAVSGDGMNKYILVDGASSKKKTSDYTVMVVMARGEDGNTYLLDGLRDRLNLRERGEAFIRMHRKWRPQRSGYEKYGMSADVEYIKELQGRSNYRFEVDELGGAVSKIDRVNRLIPLASEGKLYLPDTIYKTNTEGRTYEFVELLIEEEALAWPVPAHDDMLDAMARIFDIEDFSFPMGGEEVDVPRERYKRAAATSWMSR
jgi:predicted phage terminase large subunit-like protein